MLFPRVGYITNNGQRYAFAPEPPPGTATTSSPDPEGGESWLTSVTPPAAMLRMGAATRPGSAAIPYQAMTATPMMPVRQLNVRATMPRGVNLVQAGVRFVIFKGMDR
jgi:hypothetical protein